MSSRRMSRHRDELLCINWNPYHHQVRVPGKHAVFIRGPSRRGCRDESMLAAAKAFGLRTAARPTSPSETLGVLTGQVCDEHRGPFLSTT